MASATPALGGFGELARLSPEIRDQIYAHYFANALVVEVAGTYERRYDRDLLLVSKAVFEEAVAIQNTTNFNLNLPDGATLAPLYLRKTATTLTTDFWPAAGFPVHEYPKLQELVFEYNAGGLDLEQEHNIDPIFKGHKDDVTIAMIKHAFRLNSFAGGMPFEQPATNRSNLVVRFTCFAWLCDHHADRAADAHRRVHGGPSTRYLTRSRKRMIELTVQMQDGVFKIVHRRSEDPNVQVQIDENGAITFF